MRLSVIINTYNREPYLRRLLSSLERLANCQFEVVVVNGPSSDGTGRLLARYAERLKIADCPTRNLSESRNLGIAAAAGDIVTFIDDDALPVDDAWGARYVAAFEQAGAGTPLGAVGGPVWHHDTVWKEFDGGLTGDYGFQVFDIAHGRPEHGRWWPRVQGCNCAFLREAMTRIGGFDEFFLYYHDETDVCLRLARAGFATRHLPDNGVRHYAAASERRTSRFDRNWRIVTQSDTYFALKNGGDALPVRVLKTIAGGPRKHYFGEINSYFFNGEIGVAHWLRLLSQWASGFAAGFRAGLAAERRFASFDTPPPPFLPFVQPRTDRLTVALLTQAIPGQPGSGGVGRYTYDLARALHERGHAVHVLCRGGQRIVHRTPGFTIHGITDEDIAAQSSGTDLAVTGKNVRYSLALTRRLREIDALGGPIDVVHASNWDAHALALIRAGVYPVVLTLVSPLAQVIQTEGWAIDRDLRNSLEMDRWQIREADAVAVPSAGVLGSYRHLMGLEADEIPGLTVVPLGIVPDLRTVSATPGGRRRLLFVGRLERRKGIHVLLEALPSLLEAFADWECVIVGDDAIADIDGRTQKDRFLAQYAGQPWTSRVRFAGVVSDAALLDEYRACDVFVAPSLFESFGLIFHEAMQYGKPVVGCRTGGIPETVADGEDGLLVEPGDAVQLREALARLMSDEGLRARLGERGRQRVQERQNADTMADGYEALYRTVVSRVGDQRARRRHALWPRPLALNGPEVRRAGTWRVAEAIPGSTFVMSDEPGASLAFDAPAGATINLTCLRHSWSGVLAVRIDAGPRRLINLYKPNELEASFVTELSVPELHEGPVTVELAVHPERDPESFARQIWIRQILCTGPAGDEP